MIRCMAAGFLFLTLLAGPAPGAASITNVAALLEEVQGLCAAAGHDTDPQPIADALVREMVKQIDPGGQVFTPVAWKTFTQTQAGYTYQLPLSLTFKDGQPAVAEVSGDLPLQSGDLITYIDDTPVGDAALDTIQQLLQGSETGSVAITTAEDRYQTNQVSLQRIYMRQPGLMMAQELPADLCYMKLNGLYAASQSEVISTLRSWDESGRFGAVLDLRHANGNDLDAVEDIAGMFDPHGAMLGTVRDLYAQDIKVLKSMPTKPLRMPVMVLVDRETTQAAAVLAAVLGHSVRGVMLIGTQTDHDLLVRQPFILSTGDILYMVDRTFTTADGTVFDGTVGVTPDITLDGDETGYHTAQSRREEVRDEDEKAHLALMNRIGEDTVLRRAVDILQGLKALNIKAFE